MFMLLRLENDLFLLCSMHVIYVCENVSVLCEVWLSVVVILIVNCGFLVVAVYGCRHRVHHTTLNIWFPYVIPKATQQS
jgi:hypothetical protein